MHLFAVGAAGNYLAQWQESLLDPTRPATERAAAIRDNLVRPSLWRQALLRHDPRLWDLFPQECAEYRAQTAAASRDLPSCSDENEASQCFGLSVHQLQCMTANVSVQVSCLTHVSTSACHDVTTMEDIVGAVNELQAMLQQLVGATKQYHNAAHRKLELARRQSHCSKQLESVVRQSSADVEAAIARVQAATASGSRTDIAVAISARHAIVTEAIESVHDVLFDCREVGMDSLQPPGGSAMKAANALLDRLERDNDTHDAVEPLVQVTLVVLCYSCSYFNSELSARGCVVLLDAVMWLRG